MAHEFILATKTDSIATITLNRPQKRNAMNGAMVSELLQAIRKFADEDTRVLIVNGNGENFCAGGDLEWMQKISQTSPEENYQDAKLLADLFYALYSFPNPTIVLAHGMTLGGGLGLLSACDIAIAAKDASFGFPEVKIGLTPSMISPYAIAAIGERFLNYYFLTGERFDAREAFRLGLIHQVVENEALHSQGLTVANILLKNSPQAVREAKTLLKKIPKEKISKELSQFTAEHLARLRETSEAQEGFRAFLEKRPPQFSYIKKA